MCENCDCMKEFAEDQENEHDSLSDLDTKIIPIGSFEREKMTPEK